MSFFLNSKIVTSWQVCNKGKLQPHNARVNMFSPKERENYPASSSIAAPLLMR